MGVWGVETGSCREELLKPLGLVSCGGTTKLNEMYYTIKSIDKNKKLIFDVNVKDINDIEKIYSKHIKDMRKYKLNRINERI